MKILVFVDQYKSKIQVPLSYVDMDRKLHQTVVYCTEGVYFSVDNLMSVSGDWSFLLNIIYYDNYSLLYLYITSIYTTRVTQQKEK